MVFGGTVSNGSTWIAGGNDVTITSDFSTGDESSVLIIPINTACGFALASGSYKEIPISRPAPTLTIRGAQDYICTTNGSTSFILNSIPCGATVQWSLSNTTDSQITGSSTSSSVTVNRTSSANATSLLTATVSHCAYTYVRQQSVTLRLGTNSINFTQKDIVCVNSKPYFYGAVNGFPSATNYAWYAKDESNSSNPFILKQSSNENTADFPLGNNRGNRYYTIRVIATNPCGDVQSIDADGYTYAPDCNVIFAFSASPNPSSSTLTVEAINDKDQEITFYKMQLLDRNGKMMKQKDYKKGIKNDVIDISDLNPDFYILKIWDGKTWSSKTIIKK